jgi:flagellar biogenesis protein FliO
MRLLTILALLCSSVSYAEDKQPPATQQTTPAPAKPEPAKPAPLPEPSKDLLPPPLPSSSEMTNSYEGAFVRMLVTLLGLVFLVFATFWILRRLGKGKFSMGAGKTIAVMEKKSLSPKTMLYIVEIEGKRVLISESQVEVRALTTVELPTEPTE